jgi:hypothetical protein
MSKHKKPHKPQAEVAQIANDAPQKFKPRCRSRLPQQKPQKPQKKLQLQKLQKKPIDKMRSGTSSPSQDAEATEPE